MSTPSKKHQNFVSEPMGDKLVTELPGVGDALGNRMAGKGYDKASMVLGEYLTRNQSSTEFQDWMKDSFGANSKQSADCYNALKEWCDNNL